MFVKKQYGALKNCSVSNLEREKILWVVYTKLYIGLLCKFWSEDSKRVQIRQQFKIKQPKFIQTLSPRISLFGSCMSRDGATQLKCKHFLCRPDLKKFTKLKELQRQISCSTDFAANLSRAVRSSVSGFLSEENKPISSLALTDKQPKIQSTFQANRQKNKSVSLHPSQTSY